VSISLDPIPASAPPSSRPRFPPAAAPPHPRSSFSLRGVAALDASEGEKVVEEGECRGGASATGVDGGCATSALIASAAVVSLASGARSTWLDAGWTLSTSTQFVGRRTAARNHASQGIPQRYTACSGVGELAGVRICGTKEGKKTVGLRRRWVVAWVIPPGHHVVEHSDLRSGNDTPVPASTTGNLAGRFRYGPIRTKKGFPWRKDMQEFESHFPGRNQLWKSPFNVSFSYDTHPSDGPAWVKDLKDRRAGFCCDPLYRGAIM
jgi:hypothetical protein